MHFVSFSGVDEMDSCLLTGVHGRDILILHAFRYVEELVSLVGSCNWRRFAVFNLVLLIVADVQGRCDVIFLEGETSFKSGRHILSAVPCNQYMDILR